MSNQSDINKTAWNYRAYEFFNSKCGTPEELAAHFVANRDTNINQRYTELLVDLDGKKILNALGSNGRKAVPLCLLGAEVTIIDISEENRQYALELARHAGVELRYEIGDFATYENAELAGYFDMFFSEGGILHYFNDLDAYFKKAYTYLKPGGTMILNDFHPYRKILHPECGTGGDYFDTGLHEHPVAYQNFEDLFPEEERVEFPQCLLRFFTIGEIITAIGQNGLCIKEMRELKRMGMEQYPGEFTIVAKKSQPGTLT